MAAQPPGVQITVGVLTDSRQRRARFGRYAAELLRAEGITDVQVLDLTDATPAELQRCGIVVLASMGAVAGLLELLSEYVQGGGRLILLRPAVELAPLLGLQPEYRALRSGAVLVDTATTSFDGFPYDPLQVVTPIDLYHYAPGESAPHVAALAVGAPWSVSAAPVIVERTVGPGQLIAFLYDLPETVARIRQGDPALSEVDTDGLEGVRPHDAQTWLIDPAMAHVPQAEVHQALLGRAVEALAPWPLPRLWHLPGDAQSLLVLTGDLCSNRPDAWLLDEAEMATRHGATLSYYLHVGTQLEPETIARLRGGGHTLSIHPFSVPFSVPHMDTTLGRHLEVFTERFGPPAPRTVRHHRLQWLGWAEQARLELSHGLLMDLNFTTARPVRNGYSFGAGRPLRFVDESGDLVDCWQQPTQFEDDLILGDHEISLRIGTAEAIRLYDDLLDASLARWHSVMCINLHPGNFARYSGEWGTHAVSSSVSKGVPVWNAERWLDFTLARAATRVSAPTAQGHAWHVDVTNAAPDLTLMVPDEHASRSLTSHAKTPTVTHYGRRYHLLPLTSSQSVDLTYG